MNATATALPQAEVLVSAMEEVNSAKSFIGIDFEYGNNTLGSICAYGLAFPDGTREHGFVQLHPDNPEQTHTRFHGITQAQTDGGMEFFELYVRIETLTAAGNIVLVAHDLKSDRRAWHAACTAFGLKALPLLWADSLTMARTEVGASKEGGRTGIDAMAARYGLTINHHNPADDAWISLEIALRSQVEPKIIDDTEPSQLAGRVRRSPASFGYIPWEPSYPGELRPRKDHQHRQIAAARKMIATADPGTPGTAEIEYILDRDLPMTEIIRGVRAIPGQFAADTFEAMIAAIAPEPQA